MRPQIVKTQSRSNTKKRNCLALPSNSQCFASLFVVISWHHRYTVSWNVHRCSLKSTNYIMYTFITLEYMNTAPCLDSGYRIILLKWSAQGLVFHGILKGQESKIWVRLTLNRSSLGPQKLDFSKLKDKSVDNKFAHY